MHYWHLMGETRDSGKHSTVHRMAPTAKNYPAPSVSGAKADKSCPKMILSF